MSRHPPWYHNGSACLKILCVSAFRTVPERAAFLISHFLESFREARPLKNQTAQGRALPDGSLCVLICETESPATRRGRSCRKAPIRGSPALRQAFRAARHVRARARIILFARCCTEKSAPCTESSFRNRRHLRKTPDTRAIKSVQLPLKSIQ